MEIAQVHAQAVAMAEQMVAERCKVDLFYLCKYILGGEEVLDPRVHGPLCKATRPLLFYGRPDEVEKYDFPSDWGREESQGLPTEADKQAFLEWQQKFEPDSNDLHAISDKFDPSLTDLLALMPRGTLKTTVLTIGFTIQFLLNYPNGRVLLDSETFTKSCAFLAEIKGHYEGNPKLRKVFYTLFGCYPDDRKRSDAWSTTAINLACRDWVRKEESISCAGIDVTKNGMHYDLAMLDDLHSEKNTRSAEQIQQVKDHRKLVYSLLDPGRPCCIVGTRWDDDDAYQEIIDTESEEFNFITRKAIADDEELFYPNRLTKKDLDRFRKKQGSYMFSCQYLNNPVDDETADFKRENFSYITPDDLKKIPHTTIAIVDPSYTDPTKSGVQSDWAVIARVGMGIRREIYFKGALRAKMSYDQLIDAMFAMQDQHPEIERFYIEVIGTKTLEYDLERKQSERVAEGKPRLKVIYVRSRPRSKYDRIKALTAHYNRGDAYHVVGAPELKVLEAELLRFPKSKNDDVSDAWSDVLEHGRQPRAADVDDMGYQKRKRYTTMIRKPRSPMMGY